MAMTFEEYIVNPMGKSNAVLSAIARESIRSDYTNRFNNVLLRENGKINFFLYKDTKKNTYYVHVKVPSEVVPDFYYDTVIKFYTDSSVADLGRSLDKYYVQFFSNDPAFVFTYAHTFIKNDLFVRELIPRMSKIAVKERAKEKNPHDINGYVKSIYFTYLFMKQRGLFSAFKFDVAENFDIKALIGRVEDADTKIADRQEQGAKVDKRKKIPVDKKTVKNVNNIIGSDNVARSRMVTYTNKTTGVKKTQAGNTVRKSKIIGHK